ncbi:hypothetical protein V7O61_08590 [Methanolobus sp. WCC1]|uniref:DUF6979 family protein n=1 Tax=unclassified Methanolobus TaxID=2629569 RepID=UPI00324ED686
MMGKYGETAIKAAKAIAANKGENPEDIWNLIASDIFGAGTSSQRKVCPRNAFLGLCEEGLIRGIPKGNYTDSKKNKKYALKAVEILRETSNLVHDKKALWLEVAGESKSHNSQMDVVITLWKNGFIKDEKLL